MENRIDSRTENYRFIFPRNLPEGVTQMISVTLLSCVLQ